ncbi:bifunctional folylpolyglutamate synthase/dihydrofolate synthase [Sulfurimonas lithotrophica]|uniref:Bifunctional folylpolyglutamate synthase/dihydrofolate synthase n=1 Tax=Sulfurimonas lithotrophica TaxID=2590022 RepID=A0A5P8P213_9BACT|nr:bifunctional folylpolyglutamate synthase/dihydrofolate synthase [Sulfurimonas lithotrophica]QFR49773.1 bifunctional folylpolyglutamate synthase/dihydrofolate synthase [Sulfurimonas lithotrophica]
MHTLTKFLDSKPLFYDEIDYNRFPKTYKKIKKYINIPKIVHLIGTNGKGTTGRFLATALFNNNYSVGHYTSPHILKFNERIWINGSDVSDEVLEDAHKKLYTLLDKEDSDALSYFEYTTLLAMLVFEGCDFVVLEAGLGGEFDATAVFEKELSLVTPIDLDHQAFLGSTIEAISKTKLNSIQNNAIISKQKYSKVYDIASQMNKNIIKIEELLNKQDYKKIDKIADFLSLASYLKENLSLAIGALKFLGIDYKKSDFKDAKLFGRLSKIDENIIVDVGHNPLAASSVVKELAPQKYILIYNSYKDKDYEMILKILKPIIKEVQIIDIEGERIENKVSLHNILKHLKIEYSHYYKTEPNNKYLVFGSFSVVERFLKEYIN